MNEYLLSVIGVVILSAIVTSLLPEGKTAGTIKLISRLVCILAIISPVLHFFRSGTLSFKGENSKEIFTQTVIQSEERFIEYYSEMRIRETESALKAEILEKYALDVEVAFDYERQTEEIGEIYAYEKIRITKIRVKLNQESKEEVLRNMWEYLTKNYCSEVLIE